MDKDKLLKLIKQDNSLRYLELRASYQQLRLTRRRFEEEFNL